MYKIRSKDLSIILLFISMAYFNGFKNTCSIVYQTLKYMSFFLIQLYNTSILTIFFKHWITYTIVGIIFAIVSLPRGKEGHVIGKILYFVVGYLVCAILDLISGCIF